MNEDTVTLTASYGGDPAGGKRYTFRRIWWCEHAECAAEIQCEPWLVNGVDVHENCGGRLLEVRE